MKDSLEVGCLRDTRSSKLPVTTLDSQSLSKIDMRLGCCFQRMKSVTKARVLHLLGWGLELGSGLELGLGRGASQSERKGDVDAEDH